MSHNYSLVNYRVGPVLTNLEFLVFIRKYITQHKPGIAPSVKRSPTKTWAMVSSPSNPSLMATICEELGWQPTGCQRGQQG